MTTIVTRAGKGSPLTNNEVDANFTNLNDAKVEIGGDLSGTALSPTVSKIQNRTVAATAPADGDAYVWDAASSTWVPGPAGGGAGTITGPATSTDNALVRWDGTTGTAIKNSGSTLDSAGVLSTPATVVTYTQLDTVATPPTIIDGTIAWDNYNGTAQLGLKGGNVTLQVGQEMVARVYNNSGVALTDGQVVYIDGAQINRISVKLARADTELTSSNTLGVVTEPIAIGAEGFITLMGQVNGLDTSGLTSGGMIYLSPTVAGAFTQTKPAAPNNLVILGWVERVDATTGSIYIRVDNGYELDELHDVQITTPTGGNLISYDQTAGYWKNVNLTDGTGISITEDIGGAITVSNTAPDQTVILTAGTGITTSGTYPSFTITNTAPDQTVALTGAGTSVITGTYPNFTITSNDEFDGTVTSVGGTGTVNGITLTGTVTASGNLTLGGALSGVDLTTQVSGTLPIANGGTGLTSVGVNGTVLTSDGTTASWVAPAGGGAAYNRTSFTATAGQTTFSVAYTVGYVEVYVNGVLLNASDYTASSGTSVVLSTACVVNDIVEFIAYNTITTAITNANNLVGGVASQIPYQTGSGTTSFIANGTSGQVLTSNGASAPAWTTLASGYTLGTPQTFSSQYYKDFSSIPTGVKQIIVTIKNVVGGTVYAVQLGTGGVLATSGYVNVYSSFSASGVITSNSSNGIGVSLNPGATYCGVITLSLQDSSTNTWVANGTIERGGQNSLTLFSGMIALSGALSDLRFGDITSTDLITGGSVNIMYI